MNSEMDCVGGGMGEVPIASLVLGDEAWIRVAKALAAITRREAWLDGRPLDVSDEMRAYAQADGSLAVCPGKPEYGSPFRIEAGEWHVATDAERAVGAGSLGAARDVSRELADMIDVAFWPGRAAAAAAWEEKRSAAMRCAATMAMVFDRSETGMGTAATFEEHMLPARRAIDLWRRSGAEHLVFACHGSAEPAEFHMTSIEEDLMQEIMPKVIAGVADLGYCFVLPATRERLERRILTWVERVQPLPPQH